MNEFKKLHNKTGFNRKEMADFLGYSEPTITRFRSDTDPSNASKSDLFMIRYHLKTGSLKL